ncbi:class E sortase [Streptomyces tagetis]|uniref:Class E sortase n=1 Tax=Streptomyces tagetis TaxID=2820809 RepID=A0A940XFS9_9ACTN|nr:class E sortase [Streptomyces sp. RG38]MBQ0827625.1 class E sortase [Streptomyces sp. RG38]
MAATTDTDHEEHTAAPGTPPPAGRRRGAGRLAALAVSFLGELLITAGLVLGLFVAYSLWWTNVVADRAADRQAERVRDTWAREAGPSGPGALDTKAGIGFLHVPAMGAGEVLVEKGTSSEILNDGVAGYYTDPVEATLPASGEKGNFSLAAHRDGHGAKFHDIHKIKKGDPIVFETKDTWYVYKVYGILPETSKYNVDVLAPVPEESGREEAGHYITLTTCTPVYTSRYRYVVWGELVRTEKVDGDRTPPKELG